MEPTAVPTATIRRDQQTATMTNGRMEAQQRRPGNVVVEDTAVLSMTTFWPQKGMNRQERETPRTRMIPDWLATVRGPDKSRVSEDVGGIIKTR